MRTIAAAGCIAALMALGSCLSIGGGGGGFGIGGMGGEGGGVAVEGGGMSQGGGVGVGLSLSDVLAAAGAAGLLAEGAQAPINCDDNQGQGGGGVLRQDAGTTPGGQGAKPCGDAAAVDSTQPAATPPPKTPVPIPAGGGLLVYDQNKQYFGPFPPQCGRGTSLKGTARNLFQSATEDAMAMCKAGQAGLESKAVDDLVAQCKTFCTNQKDNGKQCNWLVTFAGGRDPYQCSVGSEIQLPNGGVRADEVAGIATAYGLCFCLKP